MDQAKLRISDSDFERIGRDILTLNSDSLADAASRIGQSFAEAVRVLLNAQGRVVVTGLGKSGHVARKLSSTLASTGTPSFYLHPSEAMHGDFGMLGVGDCVIAIAYGGETDEVVTVASFARRHDLPVVVITGNVQSRLAQLGVVVLDGSVAKEACPHNLAPTTSTVVAMAVGDALAVATMTARGFGRDQFAELHPGGRLGQRLRVRVSEIMRSRDQVPLVSADAGFHAVLEAVTKNNFGIVGIVTADEKLIGCVTDGDVRRVLLKHGGAALELSAQDWMSPSPKTIGAGCLAVEAAKHMEKHHVTALFVVADGDSTAPVGIVRMHDLLDAKIL